MTKTVTLCGMCAVTLREKKFALVQTGGRTEKILCDACGKRRYGTQYEMTAPNRRRQSGEEAHEKKQ